jgi:hypothetical protein
MHKTLSGVTASIPLAEIAGIIPVNECLHQKILNSGMETVFLKPLHHRGQESIGIYYQNSNSLNLIVKKLSSVKWSQTNKCWYLPLSEASYNQVGNALRAHAIIDYKELKEYLEKRKKVAATKPLTSALPQQPAISPRPLRREGLTKKAITLSPAWASSQQNLDALHFFVH